MRSKYNSLVIFLCFCVSNLFSQVESLPHSCLFYNLENMFHPADDPSPSDDDFTPEGQRHWTYYRYYQKLNKLCKVILAANEWDPPHLICLCELENRQVLDDFTSHPLLMNFTYEILHKESKDHRGIDVAILYRPDKLHCVDTCWLEIKNIDGHLLHTRDIVCAKFQVDNDTLLLAANHWTSKYGGALETEGKRLLEAFTLGAFIDSCLKAQPGLYVIAGGDMNDDSESQSISILRDSFHLKEIFPENNLSTYKYQGVWESIDHVFTAGRINHEKCRAEVITNPFLLEEDEKYTGLMPYRTYRGYAYKGGISDHLPLLLQFRIWKHP